MKRICIVEGFARTSLKLSCPVHFVLLQPGVERIEKPVSNSSLLFHFSINITRKGDEGSFFELTENNDRLQKDSTNDKQI